MGLGKIARELSRLLPSQLVCFLYFVYRQRYIPNFKKPRSFSEKINYIKLHNRYELRAKVTDRIWVRDYVTERSSSCKLISVLWYGTQFTNEIWDGLPNRFVIKANHGSQMVKIVDKKVDSFFDISELVSSWISKDYSQYGREWFYDDLEKYVIVEELLLFKNDVPPDFKFFCFNGKVEFIQVDLNRFSEHRRNLYDVNFNKLQATLCYPNGEDIARPTEWETALQVASDLSLDFDFIRVDLYLLDGNVYFGELTNTPGAGVEPIYPRDYDFELGKRLPSLLYR